MLQINHILLWHRWTVHGSIGWLYPLVILGDSIQHEWYKNGPIEVLHCHTEGWRGKMRDKEERFFSLKNLGTKCQPTSSHHSRPSVSDKFSHIPKFWITMQQAACHSLAIGIWTSRQVLHYPWKVGRWQVGSCVNLWKEFLLDIKRVVF